MDKDRTVSAATMAKGSVKRASDAIMSDSKSEADGAAENKAGKAQSTVWGVRTPCGTRSRPADDSPPCCRGVTH